jgi:hypothetical protein
MWHRWHDLRCQFIWLLILFLLPVSLFQNYSCSSLSIRKCHSVNLMPRQVTWLVECRLSDDICWDRGEDDERLNPSDAEMHWMSNRLFFMRTQQLVILFHRRCLHAEQDTRIIRHSVSSCLPWKCLIRPERKWTEIYQQSSTLSRFISFFLTG